MLSRAAKRKAAVSGNSRSRLRQVLLVPFQLSETMPTTMENVPNRLLKLGRSWRNDTANRVANSGVLLVKQDVIDAPSRSMPLNMKKRAMPGTKMPTSTNIRLAGSQSSIAVDKQPDEEPEKQRVDAQVGEQAAKVIDDEYTAVDQNHRQGEPEGGE